MIFHSKSKDVTKMRKLVAPLSVKQTTAPGVENEPPIKMRKISLEMVEVGKLVLPDTSPNRWFSFAQELLKLQFPYISGFQSTPVATCEVSESACNNYIFEDNSFTGKPLDCSHKHRMCT